MIEVQFDEDALRHYGRFNLPGASGALSIDHLDCAIHTIKEEPCPLCESFNNAIREAIMRVARTRLTNIPLIDF